MPPLPNGWILAYDATQQLMFYYNPSTKEGQWTHPTIKNPKISDLPPGWVETVDKQGFTFYFNDYTGQTQWDKPK